MTAPPISVFTTEQIELAARLESIFMPHARKQRDVLYANEPDEKLAPRFVHYTSAENALSIIKTKRLWMRNASCMSDYREVHHGFDILAKFFSDKPRLDAFTTALDQCTPGAAVEAINLFNQWWNNIREDTYIASISEHLTTEDLHGRLSMWRAFGHASARVALVFRIPKFSGGAAALNLLFSPVAYLTETEAHNVIGDTIKNIQADVDFLRGVDRQVIINNVFVMLLAGVTCLKHEGFLEEREWRAIYSPKRSPSSLMESSAEVIAGVPQIVCKIPLDAAVSPVLAELDIAAMFDRLIIGPSPYPLAMHEAFKAALTTAGVVDAGSKIFASLIPIRS
jgi:hypothetical protein